MQLTTGSVYRTVHDSHRRFVITATDPVMGPTTIIAYGKDGRITTWGIASGDSDSDGGTVASYQYIFQTLAVNPGWKKIQVSKTNILRYSWLLKSIADHNGNEIDYDWLDGSLCDGEFIPGAGEQFAPLSIRYTRNSVSGLKDTKLIQFNYQGGVGCGSKPLGQNATFIAGMRFASGMPLANIQMSGPNSDGSATVLLRQYNFTYGNDVATGQLPSYAARMELTDLLECDGGNVCRPAIHFSYGEIGPLDGEWSDTVIPSASVGVVDQDASFSNFPPRIYVADLNYDGRDDLVYGAAIPGSSPLAYVSQLSTGDPSSSYSRAGVIDRPAVRHGGQALSHRLRRQWHGQLCIRDV